MMEAADLVKLQCIVFGINVQLIEVSNYGIKCNKTLMEESLTKGQFLLDLINISPTVCKALECAVLAFNESKTLYCLECSEPCVREVVLEDV